MMAPSQSTNHITGAANGSASGRSKSTQEARSPVQEYLTNCKSLYSCIYCRTHLANHDELVSRTFQGNHGRAYLFNSVVNISFGPVVQRELTTGSHIVTDIFCANCRTTLGWRYEKAYVDSQKYKEGKYIIELAHVVRENRHLEFDRGLTFLERNRTGLSSSSSTRPQSQLTTLAGNHPRRSSLQSMAASSGPPHRNPLTSSSSSGQWSPDLNEEVAAHKRAREGEGDNHFNDNANYDENEDDDDDDEELMFPFYDDMCAGRSSYPSNLSSSLHNRMRRSLYLESTPYDWKYATSASSSSSSSSSADNCNAETSCDTSEFTNRMGRAPGPTSAVPSVGQGSCCSGSSLADSGLSDPSPSASSSSSSDASPKQRQISYHNGANQNCVSKSTCGNPQTNGASKYMPKGRGSNRGDDERYEREIVSDEEMQFKFEADRPESVNNNRSAHEQTKHCDQLNSNIKTLGNETEHHHQVAAAASSSSRSSSSSNNNNGNTNNNSYRKESENEHNVVPQNQVPSRHLNPPDNSDLNCGNSISVEDEEFYDCYTDHEVSTLTVGSESGLAAGIAGQ